MKKYLMLSLSLSAGVFTAVIAWRLSSDALALIAGILVGVIAMSPTLLVIFWLIRGQSQARASNASAQSAYPPIIVAGGAPLSLPQQQPPTATSAPLPPPAASSAPRRWEMRVYDEV